MGRQGQRRNSVQARLQAREEANKTKENQARKEASKEKEASEGDNEGASEGASKGTRTETTKDTGPLGTSREVPTQKGNKMVDRIRMILKRTLKNSSRFHKLISSLQSKKLVDTISK